MIRRALPFLPLLLGACSFGPSHWAEANDSLEIRATGVKTMACKTHNGSIRVRGESQQNVIRVDVRRRGGANSEEEAKRCLDAIEVVQNRQGDRLELGWRWRGSRENGWHANVSFQIAQPKGITTHTRSHNGGHDVAAVDAPCDAESHNGKITVEDCTGSVRAKTHNGGIRVAGSASRVRVVTHNGGVKLDLSAADSLSGHVETHNGSITLAIGDATQTKLRCSTHNGRVSLNRELGSGAILEQSRKRLALQVGKADGELRMQTHNGGIVVK